MNRASKGLETFVSYNGLAKPEFKVFDWARPDPWQVSISWSSLGSYLESVFYPGQWYQVLGVLNTTLQLSAGQWRNEAWLWNRTRDSWDLIYRYDYAAILAEQTGGWIGSWGPTVEPLPPWDRFYNTVGALGAVMTSRNSNGVWDAWQLLSAPNCSLRNDGGFTVSFIEPLYGFGVSLRPFA